MIKPDNFGYCPDNQLAKEIIIAAIIILIKTKNLAKKMLTKDQILKIKKNLLIKITKDLNLRTKKQQLDIQIILNILVKNKIIQ